MIKTRLNIFFVFWANGQQKKGRDRSRPFNSLYPTCFRHWDTQNSRLSGHIDQIIKFTLFLIHSKYPLHCLLGASMNVADSIHVLCKFLRTMYGYVRFRSS